MNTANACLPECRIHLKEIKPVERSGSKTAETVMGLERDQN